MCPFCADTILSIKGILQHFFILSSFRYICSIQWIVTENNFVKFPCTSGGKKKKRKAVYSKISLRSVVGTDPADSAVISTSVFFPPPQCFNLNTNTVHTYRYENNVVFGAQVQRQTVVFSSTLLSTYFKCLFTECNNCPLLAFHYKSLKFSGIVFGK